MDRQGGVLGPNNHIRVRLCAVDYPKHDPSMAIFSFDLYSDGFVLESPGRYLGVVSNRIDVQPPAPAGLDHLVTTAALKLSRDREGAAKDVHTKHVKGRADGAQSRGSK